MKKRVLLTGASGFFGRACLAFLSARNFEIHAVASRAERFLPHPNTTWHECDLLNGAQSIALLKEARPEFLLHAAWCRTTPGAFWNDPDNSRHVRASLELLEAFAQNGGRRAAIVGTSAEYDWNAGVCREESTLLRPASAYGNCKLALYLASREWAKSSGCSLAWGRLFFLYGPHEHPRRLVSSIARALLQNEVAKCSSGQQQRDFLHIEDAASFFVALLDCDVEGAINIASGEAVAVKTIALQIAELLGKRELLELGAVPTSADEAPLLVADVARLNREVLDREARPGVLQAREFPARRYDLESGLLQTIEWWKENL